MARAGIHILRPFSSSSPFVAPASRSASSLVRSYSYTSTSFATCAVLFFLLAQCPFSRAQLCLDESSPSSNCLCYPGLTNAPDCNKLACGNPYLNVTARPTFDPTTAGAAGSQGCGQQCTSGWGGSNCNICENTDACQAAISATPHSGTPSVLSAATNGNVVCSNERVAYGINFGQCAIENPMIAALLPGKIYANIQRYVDPSSASLPSSSITGLSAGLTTVQMLYAANSSTPLEEQFFCRASNCSQQIVNNVYTTACSSLKCKCRAGATVCGGGSLDLTGTINSLSGDVTLECPLGSNSTAAPTAPCHIKMELLKNIFGPQGFSLHNCQYGECIQQSVKDEKRRKLLKEDDSSLSAGLIAGLAVAGLLIACFFGLIAFGCYRQRLARSGRGKAPMSSGGAAQVTWSDLRYFLPVKSGAAGTLRMRRNPRSVSRPETAAQEEYHDVKAKSSALPVMASLSGGIPILSGLSGSVDAGCMMAIMGPSGAGKSTFLDLIAGQRKAGKVLGRCSITIPGERDETVVVGFVEQSDILPPTSTVREALMFSASLKLPESLPCAERERRVAEVIELLGLSHVANSRIGDDEHRGLSGGERRRLSIGLELIARPSVLFLDEPTSGLDSVSALRVVKVLKGLSAGNSYGHGTTVICSIHQPNSQIYYTFDYICLLALGGRQVFCGPTAQAIGHLEAHGLICPAGFNPADFLLEVASDPPASLLDHPHDQEQTKVESAAPTVSTFPPSSPMIPLARSTQPMATVLTQFEQVCMREWRCLKRDTSLFWLHNTVALVVGVFVGGMYFQVNETISGFQNRVGSLFFMSAILVFSSLSALTNFSQVRLLFMRERAAGYYSPTAWLLARSCFDIVPLRLLPALTMGVVIYWMVGLTADTIHFFKFILVLVELSLVQTLFNLWLAAMSRDSAKAILVSSMINLLQLGFAGFFVNLTTITKVLRWIQYLIPLKFSLEAMTVNEVGSGLMIKDSLQGINVKISASLIMNLLFGFKSEGYWRDVIVLFGFAIGFSCLLIIAVFYKLQQMR